MRLMSLSSACVYYCDFRFAVIHHYIRLKSMVLSLSFLTPVSSLLGDFVLAQKQDPHGDYTSGIACFFSCSLSAEKELHAKSLLLGRKTHL